MGKGRIEAFSDGVFAIIITIMVLELRTPAGANLAALRPLAPVFSSYVLSFLYLGIYWSNHHHMLYATRRISGGVLWANLHLLFWLSLVPFVTRWMGDTGFATVPTMLYGVVLVLAGLAYGLLQHAILRAEGSGSVLAAAVRGNWKVYISLGLYVAAIPLALLAPWIAAALYVLGSVLWLVPDRRIEREVSRAAHEAGRTGER